LKNRGMHSELRTMAQFLSRITGLRNRPLDGG